jgi:hypothetical protein
MYKKNERTGKRGGGVFVISSIGVSVCEAPALPPLPRPLPLAFIVVHGATKILFQYSVRLCMQFANEIEEAFVLCSELLDNPSEEERYLMHKDSKH